ncbi:uncharacterized protein EI97DRAFT_449923 [Westerdykella ornata]|uniref:FAD-binding FR-type domain-containing protein n=1 Tax=Westerdykella ornata TaxID=318751 RepID=A0A6A6JKZ2_WESOR|nr:uncharacterized protein EI97DRAFT_449923 [Westerdykella ornata]KAF2277187.1 hypothetical protein EI97DRAFT_449923 [Westerdykella ornata]
MSPYPRPGRHAAEFLKGWDTDDNDRLRYSFGLTGVDQKGNFLWVDVFGWMLLVVALATLALHICNMGWRQMRQLSVMGQPSRQAYFKDNKTRWWPWIQRHILTAPLWKKRHNRTFQLSSAIENGTLPGRWHTIVLAIYVGLNIAWCCILPYGEERAEVIAALRGRSGTLAALNLIPTVLFALRNNPLIPLLQVSYDDFNLFHRWGARITIAEALVHTASWVANTKNGGGWKHVAAALRDESSYGWGMVGTIAFVFLGIQAWSPIRHAFYETFLNIHRLCVLAALVGLYLHLAQHKLPQLPWMWVVIIMWSVEVAMRMFRVYYNSLRLTRASHITVEAMPGEAVRVTVDLQRPWYPRPGCHVHIYMPAMNPLLPWTSHPFSVAWAAIDEPSHKEMADVGLPTLEGQPLAPHGPRPSRQISLICRARTGLTRQLYDKAANSEHTMFTTWGAIEGPYGGHHSLDSYGTVLLFAGGVGITHQVMYLQHLVKGFEASTTATQKLLLVWTVPESECLEWVRPWMDEVLRLKGRKKVLRVMLFITRPKKKLENVNSSSVKMFAGRPKMVPLLEEEVRNRVGAMAVTVCGSGAFADDVRGAVRPFLDKGSVDFIEEAFTY